MIYPPENFNSPTQRDLRDGTGPVEGQLCWLATGARCGGRGHVGGAPRGGREETGRRGGGGDWAAAGEEDGGTTRNQPFLQYAGGLWNRYNPEDRLRYRYPRYRCGSCCLALN